MTCLTPRLSEHDFYIVPPGTAVDICSKYCPFCLAFHKYVTVRKVESGVAVTGYAELPG